MTNLAPARDTALFVPQWSVEIFSNRYSNAEAYPHPLNVDPETEEPLEVGDVDHDFDTLRAGWIRFLPTDIILFDISIKWDIRNKPTGEMFVARGFEWLLGLDMVSKARALIYYTDSEILADTSDNTFTYPSRIVFYIDKTGITDECYPSGTVTVTGLDATETQISETVDIDGDGCYITSGIFSGVVSFSADLSGEYNVNGERATMSVWAQTNRTSGIRECRLWCDANEDGVYGLVFGGYIKQRFGEVNLSFDPAGAYSMRTCYDLAGYAEALQNNEYFAGYRSTYRCKYFDTSGQFGDCTNVTYKNLCFRQGGSSCFIGDWQTAHPNGQLVTDQGYTCPGFDPDETQPLANDGWTYDPNYAPSDDPMYEWYPPNYFRALQAVCNMMNSIEEGKATSRPWSLPLVAQVTLAEDLDESYNMVDLNWDRRGSLNRVKDKSEIEVEGEIMYVQVGANGDFDDSYSPITVRGTTIGVLRGAENTLKIPHSKGAKVNVPMVAWSGGTDTTSPLVYSKILQEPCIKHTVMDNFEGYACQAMSQIKNAPYVAWVDNFRQLQFIELDPDRPTVSGYDDHIVITPDDIIEDPTYMLTNVVNRICGQIDIDQTNWIYSEMTTNSPGLEDYKDSEKLFGTCTEEISDVHLTALKPTAGCADFTTYATNYLKIFSYPHLVENIAVKGFVPDEHHWEWVTDIRTDINDHRYDPYLRWTDPVNHHINLLGVKVYAPDFWLGKDENGEWIKSYFIVEGIRWISRVEGMRDFVTYLTISRPTTPQEWTL